MSAPATVAAPAKARPIGLITICAAVVILSAMSTLVKKADTPGPTIAFWRSVGAAIVWSAILWVREHRWVSAVDLRRALVPGIAFGLNLTLFFTAVTRTTVANAEFIGTLTPIVLVPAGALIFKEHIDRRALLFGLISVVGLSMVLFLAAPNGQASWFGNALAFTAMGTWSTYLITSRTLRATTSVASIMAAVTPIAALTVLPIVLIRGEVGDVTWRSAAYIAVLVVASGTLAHGMIMFAQRSVPVSTISLIQIAQPAMAAGWSVLLLDTEIRAVQIVGMGLVLTGLLLMIVRRQRAVP